MSLIALGQVRETLDDWEPVFVGLGTLVIAAFTGTLWWSTYNLWKATRESHALARQEFVATHRPHVIVRFIQGPVEDAQGHECIGVIVVNIGETEATITEVRHDLARQSRQGWESGGLEGSATVAAMQPIILQSGERHTFKVRSNKPVTEYERYADAAGLHELCAVGEIRYRDGNGIVRETGFFRVYDPISKSFIPRQSEEYQD
jgi:hypothetical protein